MAAKKKSKKQKRSSKKPVSSVRRSQSGAKRKTKAAKNRPAQPAEPVNRNNEIPKFDLAEKIMAEQRKITAQKRTAPAQKNQVASQQRQGESMSYAVQQPTMDLSEQRIVAEIVARDIEKLLKSNGGPQTHSFAFGKPSKNQRPG